MVMIVDRGSSVHGRLAYTGNQLGHSVWKSDALPHSIKLIRCAYSATLTCTLRKKVTYVCFIHRSGRVVGFVFDQQVVKKTRQTDQRYSSMTIEEGLNRRGPLTVGEDMRPFKPFRI